MCHANLARRYIAYVSRHKSDKEREKHHWATKCRIELTINSSKIRAKNCASWGGLGNSLKPSQPAVDRRLAEMSTRIKQPFFYHDMHEGVIAKTWLSNLAAKFISVLQDAAATLNTQPRTRTKMFVSHLMFTWPLTHPNATYVLLRRYFEETAMHMGVNKGRVANVSGNWS
jgi:hypothetical protein